MSDLCCKAESTCSVSVLTYSLGVHNLTITKLSEALYGQVTLETLSLGSGGM